ncbi:MAG TPA: ATP-binding protein [Caldilineaceae bacterium]|nr:ATP-binding protein [Caldilineaceae bacterium]
MDGIGNGKGRRFDPACYHGLTITKGCHIIHNMNKIYSRDEYYYPRWLTALLRDALGTHPIVVLTGARQVGKSTLLRNEDPFRGWRYYTFDDMDTLTQARRDPASLWAGADRVILDEVQRVPEVLLAVKKAVDDYPQRYRFVLSGSVNLLLMQRVSESLAGRAVYFVLHPLALGEAQRQPPPTLLAELLGGRWPSEGDIGSEETVDPLTILQRGAMPGLLHSTDPTVWLRWWEGYILTYLERDLRQMAQIEALPDFRRLMDLLALHTGQLLNQSELGRGVGMSQPTTHRYINLLETTHLMERLPSYTAGRIQRLVKSPKIYWTDPGLPVFLSGYFDRESLAQARELGAFFEALIYQHLRILSELMTPKARLYFWRTRTGNEVDFVVEQGRRLVAFEVKWSENPRFQHADGLRHFLDAHPHAQGGVLLHRGTETRFLGERILALPWRLLTG